MRGLFLTALLAAMAMAENAVYYNNNHQTFGIGSWNMSLLNWYVSPGIVAGLAVFLFIILIFLFLTCQLMAVQAPPYFVDKYPDWGKQEEVE